MYIPPFTLGVIATILAEVGLAIIYNIIRDIKEGIKNAKGKEIRVPKQSSNDKH